MRKRFCILCVLLWMVFSCLAQGSGEAGEEESLKAQKVKTFVGEVGLVYLGDSYEDDLRRIEVIDENGQRLAFIVEKGKVEMRGKNDKGIALGEIMKGDKVIVEYAQDKKNRKMALSIKVVE